MHHPEMLHLLWIPPPLTDTFTKRTEANPGLQRWFLCHWLVRFTSSQWDREINQGIPREIIHTQLMKPTLPAQFKSAPNMAHLTKERNRTEWAVPKSILEWMVQASSLNIQASSLNICRVSSYGVARSWTRQGDWAHACAYTYMHTHTELPIYVNLDEY